jgi:preprotein translocase subunit SecA
LLQVKTNTPLILNSKAKAKYKIKVTQQKIQKAATMYQNLLFRIYMKLIMFRATHRPSSEA